MNSCKGVPVTSKTSQPLCPASLPFYLFGAILRLSHPLTLSMVSFKILRIAQDNYSVTLDMCSILPS